MKKVLVLILVLFVPFFVNAMEINKEWERIAGHLETDYYFSVIELKDGGIVAGGYFDSDDSAIEPWDYFEDGILVKYDKDGNKIWEKTLIGNNYEGFDALAATNDGGFIGLFSTSSTDFEGTEDLISQYDMIIKYDKDGNMMWRKIWAGNGTNFLAGILVLEDDRFVVVGSSRATDIEGLENKGRYDGAIMMFDKNGNLLWQDSLGGSGTDEYSHVELSSDGNLLVVGKYDSTDIEGLENKGREDGLIVKYDLNGNILWKKSFGGSQDDRFYFIKRLSDNNYIIIGNTGTKDIGFTFDSSSNFIAVKIDNNCNILNQINFNEYIAAVYPTNDGGFVATGSFEDDDINGLVGRGEDDGVIIKYDKDLKAEWYEQWGGNGYDSFDWITITKDGSLYVAGEVDSDDIDSIVPIGNGDNLLVKYSIKYDIEMVPAVNGNFDVEVFGNVATIKPVVNDGYKVDRIIVRDSNNKDVTSVKLNDGTYTFVLNDDVSVEVTFMEDIVNPKTLDSSFKIIIISLFFGGVVGLIFYFLLKNDKVSVEL